MKLRIVLNLGSKTTHDPQISLFNGIPSARQPGIGSLFSSVAFHVLALTLITSASRYWLRDDAEDWSKYTVEPLRLHLAQPIFFSPATKKAAPRPSRPKPAAAPAPTAEAAAAAPVADAPAPESRAAAVTRRFELPKPREAAKDGPVILQPEYVPQASPRALPPLAFWARQTPEAPKPPAKTEIVPGRAEAPTPAPKLAAPPVLAAPNRESNVAQVNISLPEPKTPATPALPVPNSTTMPVRLRDASESRSASFEVTAGQAVNVMTLAAERRDVSHIEIPKGLQNIPNSTPPVDGPPAAPERPAPAAAAATTANAATARPSSPPGTAAGNRPATPTAQANSAPSANPAAPPKPAPVNPAPANPAPANPAPPDSRAGSNGAAKPDTAPSPTPSNTQRDAAPRETQAASAPSERPSPRSAATVPTTATVAPPRELISPVGTPPAAAPPPPPSGGTPPEVTRIDHPNNGNFDVVIMQSAARDDLPDLGGMLSGNPVYTVYLRVGDKKEWLLEYCVPVRETAQSNPYQVNIDDVGSITPPYPISTLIPNGFLSLQNTRHMVLHGLLTTAGSLHSIKAQDAGNSLMTQLVALLTQWRFRPALRNKQPIEVEVLLVIPPRG